MSDEDEPKGTYSKLYEMTRKSTRVQPEEAPPTQRRTARVRVVEPSIPETEPAQAPRMGRPPREVRRKQKTVYMTEAQIELLDDLQYQFKRRFKVEQSDLVGLAIELLGKAVEMQHAQEQEIHSLDALRDECMRLVAEAGIDHRS